MNKRKNTTKHKLPQPYFLPKTVIPALAFTTPEAEPDCQLCGIYPAPICEDEINYCPGCYAAYGAPWPGEMEGINAK